jgi:AcrR family transcriptional regulator
MTELAIAYPTPPMADPPLHRSVGRPRDPRLDAAVLAATRALLVEAGYHQLSIEAVARRAHVHRPVIYRRWRSKAELVHDAVFCPADDTTLRIADTGNFRDDLRACIHNSIALFRRPEVLSAFPGLMAAQRIDPELRRVLMPRLEVTAGGGFEAFVRRAVARGDARPVVTIETLFDVLAGTVLFHIAASAMEAGQALETQLFTVMARLAGIDEAPRRAAKLPSRRKTPTRPRTAKPTRRRR